MMNSIMYCRLFLGSSTTSKEEAYFIFKVMSSGPTGSQIGLDLSGGWAMPSCPPYCVSIRPAHGVTDSALPLEGIEASSTRSAKGFGSIPWRATRKNHQPRRALRLAEPHVQGLQEAVHREEQLHEVVQAFNKCSVTEAS